MKKVGNTKELIDKTKNGENVPYLELVQVVLVQRNLVDNQNQQNSELLYTFTRTPANTNTLDTEVAVP